MLDTNTAIYEVIKTKKIPTTNCIEIQFKSNETHNDGHFDSCDTNANTHVAELRDKTYQKYFVECVYSYLCCCTPSECYTI